ncbi:unnamed protein product [Cyclocybe aegerita]|uniref:DUF7726 domain-containing protein n=1 Tax=Cyclocybe aegerita TaxID=1973307 RepID=A0A8S0VSC9_CYCAE|nr:unnamed protein product [Cyclocybe aegerita]
MVAGRPDLAGSCQPHFTNFASPRHYSSIIIITTMAVKRKSDALEQSVLPFANNAEGSSTKPSESATSNKQISLDPPAKKARKVSTGSEASTSTSKPTSWKDIVLPEENEDGGVPVYDDCSEVRRKIRLLQKEPGWKLTPWLRDIGGINNNSYNRFMREKGKNDGAGNGTYYAAYVYFEKIRILEGKKKTKTRENNEAMYPNGFPLQNASRYVWGPRR